MPTIQAYCEKYMQTVLDIWLSSNLQAHSFIPADYWKKNLSLLRDALPKSEVYLCCEGETPVGFIGLEGDLIAGLFVAASARGAGVGSALLQHCQRLPSLAAPFCIQKEHCRPKVLPSAWLPGSKRGHRGTNRPA